MNAHHNAVSKYYSKTQSSQQRRNLLNYYIKIAEAQNITLQQLFDIKLAEYSSRFNDILLLYQQQQEHNNYIDDIIQT